MAGRRSKWDQRRGRSCSQSPTEPGLPPGPDAEVELRGTFPRPCHREHTATQPDPAPEPALPGRHAGWAQHLLGPLLLRLEMKLEQVNSPVSYVGYLHRQMALALFFGDSPRKTTQNPPIPDPTDFKLSCSQSGISTPAQKQRTKLTPVPAAPGLLTRALLGSRSHHPPTWPPTGVPTVPSTSGKQPLSQPAFLLWRLLLLYLVHSWGQLP